MDEVRQALLPDHPVDDGLLIDLHGLSLEDGEEEFWQRASALIQERVKGFIEHRVLPSDLNTLAVFAFAPIPLVAMLGRVLGDKLSTRVFERHQHSNSWRWDHTGDRTSWLQLDRPNGASSALDVAILLSVSGKVQDEVVRAVMPALFDVYRLSVTQPRPNLP